MSKEHAYAYEAGYRDGSINYELEHCPACKNVADLQEALSENAKLRRLVHRLISHVEHPPCEGCLAEMSCDGEHVTQCDEWLFMVADARKLGVEVDE